MAYRPAYWPRRGTTQQQAGLRDGFRSGLEDKNAAHLEKLIGEPVPFESFKIKYEIPASMHTYTPDFILPNGIIIETKGRWLPADRTKHLLVRAQWPQLDIRMVFTSSKARIAPGAKTTMAQFCEKHGIQYSDKLVPREWVLEDGPEVHPYDVLGIKR